MIDYYQCLLIGLDWNNKILLSPFWCRTHELMLVVGLLGNVANLIVFSHERMKSYVNSLFYWLAVFDILVLIQISTLSLIYGTELATYITSILFVPLSHASESPAALQHEKWMNRFHLHFYMAYILVSLHTVTLLLNIAIALWLYAAVMYRQGLKAWCGIWSARRTVIGAFVLGFALWIPHLFLLPEVSPSEYAARTEPLAGSPSSHKWITLICGGVVCILLLVALLTVCVALITGIIKNRRGRREVVPDLVDAGIESVGSVDQFTKEMANLTLPIVQIFIFFITELSIAVIPFLSFWYSVLPTADSVEQKVNSYFCYSIFHFFLRGLVVSTLPVSSSYITFCYLTSAHYRSTLEVSLYSGYGRLKQMLKVDSYHQVRSTAAMTV